MLLIASSSAAAQPVETNCPAPSSVRELRVGACFRSSIGPEDPKAEDSTSYEDWRLDLEAGETVQIEMDAIPTPRRAVPGAPPEPHQFDTYLELRREGVAEPLVTNDDRENSLNSLIRFTAPATDHYVVRARPLYLDEGDYRLSVSRPPAAPVAVALAAGRNQVPAAAPGGGGLQPRLFFFEGHDGERVRLTLERKMWGEQLHLIAPDGTTLAMAGEFSQSLSVFAFLPQTGIYRVEARLQVLMPVPAGSGAPAPSALDFDRRSGPSEHAPRPLGIGETVTGELGLESITGPDPYGGAGLALSELYAMSVIAGQVMTVTLESSAFDPVIDAGVISPLGYAAALTDDDGGGGRNSRLVLRIDQSGQIVLRVRALGTGVGAFQLSVRPGDVPIPQPEPTPRDPSG